jgi:hypothetical protein
VFGAADTGPVVDYIKKTHNLMTPTAAAAAKKQQRKVARPKATVPTTPQIKVTGVPDRPLPPSVKGVADAGTRIPTMLTVVPSSTKAAVPLSYSSDFSTGADHYFDSHAEYCPVETEQVSRESFSPVLRIWDVYPGSRISDTGSRISDPGSRIQNNNKREG